MSRFLSEDHKNLKEYVPGEQPTNQQYIKLNTNESPYPPSLKIMDRVNEEIGKLRLYPDPEGQATCKEIAKLYQVEQKNILLGNGSDEILSFFFLAFCDQQKGVVFPDITYGFYKVYAQLYKIPYREIPLTKDLKINASDYLKLSKNIVIANPNAPTGLALSVYELEEMIKNNQDHIVLVDEAYVDFGAESVSKLIKKYDNLLVVQTFSKSRSLAGARLGFAVACEEIIKDLRKIKYSINPYNINRLTLLAGEQAIKDQSYYTENNRQIIENREYVKKELQSRSFFLTDSKANFIFAKHKTFSGQELYEKLKQKGILIRHFNQDKISDYIRITIGSKEEMDTFLRVVDSL